MRQRIKSKGHLCVTCSSKTYIKMKHDDVKVTNTTKIEVNNFGHYKMFGKIVTITSKEEFIHVMEANIEIF